MTKKDDNAIIEILLIEDNPGDIRLFQEAIKMSTFNLKLSVIQDGEQALDFMNHKPPFTQAICPDLILLDINLPRKSGLEVLEILKKHPINRSIPVIVLTSSQAPEDIQTAYDHHANCYIVKPVQLSDFFEVINTLEKFWLHQARLPKRGQHENQN
jgi:two-component system, chemotaxis family, response regulator Rcp1